MISRVETKLVKLEEEMEIQKQETKKLKDQEKIVLQWEICDRLAQGISAFKFLI